MERVKKLEARGIMKSYHALLVAKNVDKGIVSFTGVSSATSDTSFPLLPNP
ncbi:MAG: hypothetical protein V3W37_06945 [Candidatus Binatia bacterium]